MGERSRTAVAIVGLLALTLLTGCASEGDVTPGGPSARITEGQTASDAPTGAAGTYAPSGDGAGPGADSPPQYRLNKRHHDRTVLSADAAAELDIARAKVARKLAELDRPVLQPAVEDVLDGVVAPDPWIVTTTSGEEVLFEAQVEMTGCLIGEVRQNGDAEVTAAGWVLDGGCHALDGH